MYDDANGNKNKLVVDSSGSGGLSEFVSKVKDNDVMFGFLRVSFGDAQSKRIKFVMVTWSGEAVSPMKRARISMHKATVQGLLKGYHIDIQTSTVDDLHEDVIEQKILKAAGANYDQSLSSKPGSKAPASSSAPSSPAVKSAETTPAKAAEPAKVEEPVAAAAKTEEPVAAASATEEPVAAAKTEEPVAAVAAEEPVAAAKAEEPAPMDLSPSAVEAEPVPTETPPPAAVPVAAAAGDDNWDD